MPFQAKGEPNNSVKRTAFRGRLPRALEQEWCHAKKLPSRYFVHGDRVAPSKDEYFCAACDVFASRSHFDTCHCKDHLARYERSLASFNNLVKHGSGYTRPARPENLFA